MSTKAVFLDRDGTINVDVGYPSSFDQVEIYPYAFEAVARLNKAGFLTIIITNQSGIGRGLFSEEALQTIHGRLRAVFTQRGARIDAIYYCPHAPEPDRGGLPPACSCRKPNPEMGLRAANDLGIDLRASYMVGDKIEDIEFGRNIGVLPVLVRTGFGAEAERQFNARTDIRPVTVVDTLLDAVRWILGRDKGAP
jgi:D-glycero-D-manno-heptose 1,7-bisphosphate phosphatase